MNRKEKLETTKLRIREATKTLMNECKDASEVTSRRIAAEAGVQLAMINYCFGSREALLFELFTEMNDTFETENSLAKLIASENTPKEKLRKIYFYVASFLAKEYRFTEAITAHALLHRDLSKELHTVSFVIEHYQGRRTVEECKLIAYELSSTVQLALCRKNDLKAFCGYDFDRKEDLQAYIDLQIDLFLQED